MNIKLLIYLILCIKSLTGQKLSCSLVWVEMSSGSVVPEDSISVYREEQYVARASPGSIGATIVGRYDTVVGRALIPSGGVQSSELAFEILTNPYECTLAWVSSYHGDVISGNLTVPSRDGSSNYIGRAEEAGGGGRLLSGEVDVARKILKVTDSNGTVREIGESAYYVLTSISDGLQLEVTQFEFEEDPFGGADAMLGMEIIHNNAESEVTQSITHSKTIDERVSFSSTTNIFRVAAGVSISASIGFLGIGVSASASKSQSHTVINSNSILNEKNKVVEVTRTIVVPPFTSVHACSTLSSNQDFKTNWTARAQFTCKGWSSDRIKTYVSAQPEWTGKQWTEQGNSILTTISGEFGGNLVMGTKFYVTTADGSSGCIELRNYLRMKSKERARNPNTPFDYDEHERNIRQIMNGYRKKIEEVNTLTSHDGQDITICSAFPED